MTTLVGEEKENKFINVLQFLGFHKIQAKILATLLVIGSSTAYKIARISKISPQRIYQHLDKLEKSGVVVLTKHSPRVYEISPFLLELIQTKTDEYKKRINDLNQLIRNVENYLYFTKDNRNVVKVLSGRKNVLYFLKSWILKNVRRRYWSISAFRSEFNPILQILDSLVAKGVDIRFLGPLSADRKILEIYSKTAKISIRLTDLIKAPVRMSIQDDYLSFTLVDSKGEYFTIWTNDKGPLQSMEEHFLHLWKKAIPFIPK